MNTKESENLKSVLTVWRQDNPVFRDKSIQIGNIADIVSSIFSPGKHYYFILNFFNRQIEYIHPTVEEILGCKPEEFSFEYIFKIMHPDDAPVIQAKESAAIEFFYNRVPLEKIPYYKSSYTFRVSGPKGDWKNILHQSIALEVAENGRVHHSLSVHTDITFLNPLPDNKISFIGIGGEPSYYALSTDPVSILQPEPIFEISARELEVLRLLSEGLSSKQAADMLHISTHTVDTHRRNLLKRTGAKNLLELAVKCLKQGLI